MPKVTNSFMRVRGNLFRAVVAFRTGLAIPATGKNRRLNCMMQSRDMRVGSRQLFIASRRQIHIQLRRSGDCVYPSRKEWLPFFSTSRGRLRGVVFSGRGTVLAPSPRPIRVEQVVPAPRKMGRSPRRSWFPRQKEFINGYCALYGRTHRRRTASPIPISNSTSSTGTSSAARDYAISKLNPASPAHSLEGSHHQPKSPCFYGGQEAQLPVSSSRAGRAA